MYGWLSETWILTNVYAGFPPMKFNVAYCFLELGIALYLQTVRANEDMLKMLLGFFCLPALAMVVSTTLQTVFGINTYADDFFVTDNFSAGIIPNAIPGRMSVYTAFCFVPLSIGIMLRPFKDNLGDELFQGMLHVVTLAALVVIVSYVCGWQQFYKDSPHTYMALNTAVMLFIMSAAAALIRPHAGLPGLLLKRKGS